MLSRGDRRLADVLLAIPSGGLTVRSFFQAMDDVRAGQRALHRRVGRRRAAALGRGRERRQRELLPLRTQLAARSETGLSCPPDSAGCLACQACDPEWAFRYGDNDKRPVPAAKGGPWRAEDWAPWTKLKEKSSA